MLYLTGIHQPRQLAGFRPDSWTGRRRRIALDLVDAIDRLDRPALREAMLARVVDVRGTFKRTYRDRFAAFDDRLVEMWCRHATQMPAAPDGAVHVLDVAVSDGATVPPLVDAFAGLTGGALRYTATDLDAGFVRLSRKGRPERRVIVTEAGGIVQIVVPPFLFTHRESRWLFPLNRTLRPAASRFAAELIADWRAGSSDVETAGILLLAPELRHRLETDPRVSFRAWDVLEPWHGEKAHCVRAMNVLNPGYFDAGGIARALGNLRDALAEGGLLALGSNEDAGSPVDGVICRRVASGLELLVTTGRGFRAPAALAGLLEPA